MRQAAYDRTMRIEQFCPAETGVVDAGCGALAHRQVSA